MYHFSLRAFFFFFNDTATTEIYTLSLHDALPIWLHSSEERVTPPVQDTLIAALGIQQRAASVGFDWTDASGPRSEEHTSELQSQSNLVCRLLLEKKKTLPERYTAAHCDSTPQSRR